MKKKNADGCFHQLDKGLQFLGVIILYLISVYWTTEAVLKYQSEPASTKIKFNHGDSKEEKIQFPLITICPNNDPRSMILEIKPECRSCIWGNSFKIGDGICDDAANSPQCDYDGGDCCNGYTGWCDLCECVADVDKKACIHPHQIFQNECQEPDDVGLGQGCPFPDWILGDAICDDISNTPECDYDGGDCCGGSTQYCIECECISTEPVANTSRGAATFLQHIEGCIKLVPDFNLSSIIDKMNWAREKHVTAVLFEDSQLVDNTTRLDNAWRSTVSQEFGYCYQFDLKKVQGYGKLLKNSSYEIVFSSDGGFIFIFHDDNQPPDASKSRVVQDITSINIDLKGKRIISQANPPLKRLPCTEEDYSSCSDQLLHSKLVMEYSCKVTILRGNANYGNITNENLEECSNNVTLEVGSYYVTQLLQH